MVFVESTSLSHLLYFSHCELGHLFELLQQLSLACTPTINATSGATVLVG